LFPLRSKADVNQFSLYRTEPKNKKTLDTRNNYKQNGYAEKKWYEHLREVNKFMEKKNLWKRQVLSREYGTGGVADL